MANSKLFKSAVPGPALPPTDAHNEAGGVAYSRSDKAALAQYATTGTLHSTFYAKDEDQLKLTLGLAQKVDPQFLAKTAIYAREQGYLKDMPALLTAILFARSKTEESARLPFQAAFGRCIDNGKMLKNFFQIIRSGAAGRKSLGSAGKRMIQKWFDGHTDEQLIHQSVGNDPSLADVIRLARVDPRTPARRALFKYLTGLQVGEKDKAFGYSAEDLPQLLKDYEAWKASTKSARPGKPPKVPFQMLTALELSQHDWEKIAEDATWNQVRMNLNTFLRHGVFNNKALLKKISDRLQDAQQVKRAKVFPFQLMTAYNHTSRQPGMPQSITIGLQQALEHSLRNIPTIEGQVVLAPDMSGSMGSPVTGNRDNSATGITARTGRASGATTVVQCREVAALLTAAYLRKMPNTLILPFSDRINEVRLNPLDSIATNARTLASLPSGGTDCSLPLAFLNQRDIKADLVIYVSDYESWMDTNGTTKHAYAYNRFGGVHANQSTGLMAQWRIFKARNPKARLVCVDLQPSPTGQVICEADILSIGGWSDTCFSLIADFAANGNTGDAWVQRIEAQPLFETLGVAS